jgi:MATE family multidrug resistance protein
MRPPTTPAAVTRQLLRLSAPLVAASSVQVVLGLTDTWFVGRLSVDALAAMASVQWLSVAMIMLIGGGSLAAQLLAAQAVGAGRFDRASQATWTCLWAVFLLVPVFAVGAWAGALLLPAMGLGHEVTQLAVDYWGPRLLGAPLGLGLAVLMGFFNGLGRPRVALVAALAVALTNAALNEVFIFVLGWGMAGAAWATTVAQGLTLAALLPYFLNERHRRQYRTHDSWRFDARRLIAVLRLGVPLGVLFASDLLAFALFQVLQVRHSTLHGAATQIAMQIISVAYLVGAGVAEASSLLVGQAFGRGDVNAARAVHRACLRLLLVMMGALGFGLALFGPWLAPRFISAADPQAVEVARLAVTLLWIGAAYQLADAAYLSSEFALRGAGDVGFTARLVLLLSLFLLTPLVHLLTFSPGQGFVEGAPGLGWGAPGGWAALVLYMFTLAIATSLRWRSGRWCLHLGAATRGAPGSAR